MKKIVIAIVMSGFATAAVAQGRPSTTTMTCSAASALIRQQGAAVLGTGGDTFERIVSGTNYCEHGQQLRPAFAPTRDDPHCFVGSRCFDENSDER